MSAVSETCWAQGVQDEWQALDESDDSVNNLTNSRFSTESWVSQSALENPVAFFALSTIVLTSFEYQDISHMPVHICSLQVVHTFMDRWRN